jgi:hypothetical protein
MEPELIGNDSVESPVESPVESTESPVETPSQEPIQPTEQAGQEAPSYELPDGRKVTGEELVEIHKGLLSDYTRKSQELAKYNQNINNNKNETEQKPWETDDWNPNSWKEVLDVAEQHLEAKQAAKLQAEQAREQALAQHIDSEVAEVKAIDPNVNVDQVFLHATKYGFQNLKAAHQNMRDMSQAVKTAQELAVKNIQKRAQEPIATNPGISSNDDSIPYTPGGYGSALEYLRSLKR